MLDFAEAVLNDPMQTADFTKFRARRVPAPTRWERMRQWLFPFGVFEPALADYRAQCRLRCGDDRLDGVWMSPTDLAAGVTWMEARWGYQKVWGSWESVYEDFAPYSAGALREALDQWFRNGNKFAPRPAELHRVVTETAHRRIEAGTDEPVDRTCRGRHVWAEPFAWEDQREQECAVCGEIGARVG